MYHAQLGRFCSRDPIGYKGSRWSLVEYVRSSAVTATDPSGLTGPGAYGAGPVYAHLADPQPKACCKYYDHSDGRTWVEEVTCREGEGPSGCCQRNSGTDVGVVEAVMGRCERRPGTPGSGAGRICAGAACAAAWAIPSPDPFPEEVVRTPGCLLVSGSMFCYAAAVWVGIIAPPIEFGIPDVYDDGDDYVLEPPIELPGPPRCICVKIVYGTDDGVVFLGYIPRLECHVNGGFCIDELYNDN